MLKPAPWSPVGGATYGATLAFFATFFCWHRVRGAFRTRWLFLDRLCVQQQPAAAKAAGVRSMGAFLAHSDRMLVLWSEDYCQRLWCVTELGAYMRTHSLSQIEFVPLFLSPLIIAGNFFFMIGT